MNGLPPGLPHSARAYLDAFPRGDIVAFPISGIDTVGVPVWVVALFPEDPHLVGIMPYGVGYGFTDEDAVLGALGEIAEMVFPTQSLSSRKRTRARYLDLVAVYGEPAVIDPLTLCLPAGSPVDHQTELEWVDATRYGTGQTALLPIDVVAYSTRELSAGYVPFTPLISNGMGAGPDLDWAIGHGLREILQRDGNGLGFRALDRGRLIELPWRVPARVREVLDAFGNAGIEVFPKLASDEFGLVNLYATGRERAGREPPTPIMLTACGEACHPSREAALAKALCELAASRARKAWAHGPRAISSKVTPAGFAERFRARSSSAAKAADQRALVAMRQWASADAAQMRRWLESNAHGVVSRTPFDALPALGPDPIDTVTASGFDILYVDVSPPASDISVVRVVVPGMEVETMSYARIGERNAARLLARDLGLVGFGSPNVSRNRRPIRLTEAATAKFGGPLWFDVGRARDLVGPLYPLYREPEAFEVGRTYYSAEVA